MEYIGRIAKVFDVKTGLKADKSEWKSQEFIFEYFENPNDRYSDKVVLKLMNDRIAEYDIHIGEVVRIGFGHNVREWNGTYYNDIRIYKFEKMMKDAGSVPAKEQEPLPFEPPMNTPNDLPFMES